MIIIPVEKQIDWRRPPLVLIGLVVLNVLIFAFYQSGDTATVIKAVEHYQANDMIDLEWRAYRAYLKENDLPLEFKKNDEETPYYIISDLGFDRFMAAKGERYISRSKVLAWREARSQLEKITEKISSKALGFYTDDVSIVQLLSSQFLHGGVMHLVGNMVFLILVGFAVEAALGSRIFLTYYLLSGAGAALIYAAFAQSPGSLIGASGAISGVMAMYVVLFGMRKIQFFYWVFIFTGYLRAAAIIMLPVYILKEIHSFYTLEGSNVAFTAHIGGFVCGAALVLLTRQLRSQLIDDDYLDGMPKEVDATAVALQRVYDLMGQCEFAKAWEALKPIKVANQNRSDVVELEFNLVRALHPRKLTDYLIHRMDKQGNNSSLVLAQLREWQKLKPQQQLGLAIAKRSHLLKNALEENNLEVAEQVFESLRTGSIDGMNLAVCARQIASFCQQNRQADKSKSYSALAQKYAEPGFDRSVEVSI